MTVRFVRHALKAITKNDGAFVDVILLYTTVPQALLRVRRASRQVGLINKSQIHFKVALSRKLTV
jgi:hypothetical protein